MNLSKSRYTRGVQCPKMLWMESHKPECFDESVMNQAVLSTGNEVGDLAMGYFGSFTEIPFDAHDFNGMACLTRELIERGERVICEATFEHDGNLCMVDILVNEADGVRLVEVKSSTHVHDIYLHDMAYQCWLLEQCGYHVKSAGLMHVDSSYVRQGSLDLSKLFVVEDRTDVVLNMVSQVGGRTAYLKAVADEHHEPGGRDGVESALDLACEQGLIPLLSESLEGYAFACNDARDVFSIGPHCASPYPCGYQSWCWRNVPHPSVFDLGGYGLNKAFKLVNRGIVTFEDVDRSKMSLGGLPARQLEAWRSGKDVLVDVPRIGKFLDTLALPLYFLDFETYQPAIPPFDGTHPYQQIPTQYSLHIVRDDQASLMHALDEHDARQYAQETGGKAPFEHREFLAQAGSDPRRALAEALVRDIPADACTVAYNMSFERAVIKDLAQQFPDLFEHLMAVRENMHDLMVPFRSGAYYAAAQGGSFSIKAVLPALFPNDPQLDYHALDGVRNGAEASAAFSDMASLTEEEAARVRESLLRYCELDTLAMVRIWQKLREAAGPGSFEL